MFIHSVLNFENTEIFGIFLAKSFKIDTAKPFHPTLPMDSE